MSAADGQGAGVPAAIRAEIATRLSAAAGRASFSNRRRRYDTGFTERRRRAAMRAFAAASFVGVVALPVLLALLYYGWRADDQFETEARFLLRVNEASRPDRLADVTGLPSIEMSRDTQVVAAYLESAAIVSALAEGAGLRAALEGPQPSLLKPETWLATDWAARVPVGATAEELLEQWEEVTDVEIELPAGIVVFELRAFSPEDAERLASAALSQTEDLVHALNARVWNDAVSKAETLFANAADRLAGAQARLAKARNAAGLVSTEQEAGVLSALAQRTRAEILRLEQERAAQARHLAPGSARMQALGRRLASLRAQLESLAEERVSTNPAREGLADVMARFSEIEIEQEIAERQFLAAARKLEEVRQVSEARMMYLDIFVAPRRPEDANHPRRALAICLVAGGAILVWGLLCGGVSLLRNHMA